MDTANNNIVTDLTGKFGERNFTVQTSSDGVPIIWVPDEMKKDVLKYLKYDIVSPYKMLYDLTAIDERERQNRQGQPDCDFSLVYQLLSIDRNDDIRIKVPLKGEYPSAASVTDIWPNANWYEREVYDMFGIKLTGHPNLRRILMPPWWEGHPLRKEHPARATEMGPFTLSSEKQSFEMEEYEFKPEEWGLSSETGDDTDFMFLNLGPQHPGTHGVLRIILQLDGETVVNVVPDIGFHHRAAEKMGERQTWHTYIPYTDRVDYLAGVINNLAYLLNVEKLAGINDVPPRANVIRIMLSELFRISNHLVWFGTFAQDLGQLSPVFYMFNDREKILDIIAAVTGFRMHPGWFRIGGVAADLPEGWEAMVRNFISYFPPKLKEYDKLVMGNRIFRARTIGIGPITKNEAIDWGVTGPNLRATGSDWDIRKKRPYSGYENFQFDIPTAVNGDCYDRAVVRMEEMRQSLRIIEQCVNNMPGGDYKSLHPLTTPPIKDKTMVHIETLITHFLNVSWGPVMPPGESNVLTEGAKGNYSYYLVSDGNTTSYRTHIRSASFPHMQTLPLLSRSYTIADLMSILGSMDYVLADIDR